MQLQFGATLKTPKTFKIANDDMHGGNADTLFKSREWMPALAKAAFDNAITPDVVITVRRNIQETVAEKPEQKQSLLSGILTHPEEDRYQIDLSVKGQEDRKKLKRSIKTNLHDLFNSGPTRGMDHLIQQVLELQKAATTHFAKVAKQAAAPSALKTDPGASQPYSGEETFRDPRDPGAEGFPISDPRDPGAR